MNRLTVFILISLFLFFSCSKPAEDKENPSLNMPPKEHFQTGEGEEQTNLFILSHKAGIKAAITNYGGRIVSLWVKDKEGEWTDVVLGFNSLEQFKEVKERYYGASIGRFGNRIARGSFKLGDQAFQLPQNNGPNTLHGGPEGFHEQIWKVVKQNNETLSLSYSSPDGEMGFPGELKAEITYTLTDDPGLLISYSAQTDQETPVNLTNHAFYNLNGEGSGSINQHRLMIPAESYTPVDSTLIPTGEIRSVEGTPFDFRQSTQIGERVEAEDVQLGYGRGYDHNFVITAEKTDSLHLSAIAIGDQSLIRMHIYSQEPGLQFYGGNFMDGSHAGKSGNTYAFRTAFCLETQHFPDSPNHPNFPSTLLKPAELYETQTLHTFDIATK